VLRQLARLTRPLPAAGPGALAVAVYADGNDRPVSARESGYEGVACVDDAARLLDVMCDIWLGTRRPWAERWASGLLEFVLWMQEPDGRWINFVTTWEGTRNDTGITSRAGENFWHARALVALSRAWVALGDERARTAFERGWRHAVTEPTAPDVRALHVVAGIRLVRAGIGAELGPAIAAWCDELVACTDARGILKNSPAERGTPHLWAHLQEGVLADAAVALREPRFGDVAVRSAELLLEPAIEDGFKTARSPYDAASCIYDCDRLYAMTGEDRWARLAADARAWFDGRNPAGRPVYDRDRGRVADGVDGDRISENSGSEANIVAAEALLADAIEVARRLEDPLGSPEALG
jgi:hypothetical protein